ncbi:hypothetical protein K9M18_06380, partial [Candidatus Woesearchaeota archaeon]|nr:hypothetical protein [Candidatus Woesearchaeota archaeon]
MVLESELHDKAYLELRKKGMPIKEARNHIKNPLFNPSEYLKQERILNPSLDKLIQKDLTKKYEPINSNPTAILIKNINKILNTALTSNAINYFELNKPQNKTKQKQTTEPLTTKILRYTGTALAGTALAGTALTITGIFSALAGSITLLNYTSTNIIAQTIPPLIQDIPNTTTININVSGTT